MTRSPSRPLAALLAACAALLVPAPYADAQQAKGKKYALLVGVKEYKGADFGALKYTERDVEELKKVLVKAGYEVRLLTTTAGKKERADAPTAANIRRAFAELIKGKARGDTVLLALSGHGLQLDVKDPDGKGEPKSYGYFCPSDADTTDIKYTTGHSDHLILVDDLFERLGRCQATTKLVLVDACRNELSVKAGSRNVDVGETRVPRGVAALFGCSRRQKAWEHDDLRHGVFFHAVLEGLAGRAKNEDGEVTWDALSAYVKRRVRLQVPKLIGGGARQTPHGVGSLEDDPVLLAKGAAADAEAERLYREGMDAHFGVKEVDDEAALKLFTQAGDRGHAVGLGTAGMMLYEGRGATADEAAGLKKLKAALPAVRRKAEEGDPDAQALLGRMCANGRGVDKDDREAVAWCKKAADKGHAAAMFSLGYMCANGRGVDKDDKEAFGWYRKAAVKGAAPAMYYLGFLYEKGQGVEKDDAESLKWYKKAAALGHKDAIKKLAGLKKDD